MRQTRHRNEFELPPGAGTVAKTTSTTSAKIGQANPAKIFGRRETHHALHHANFDSPSPAGVPAEVVVATVVR